MVYLFLLGFQYHWTIIYDSFEKATDQDQDQDHNFRKNISFQTLQFIYIYQQDEHMEEDNDYIGELSFTSMPYLSC